MSKSQQREVRSGRYFAFYVSQSRIIERQATSPIKDLNIMGNGPKMLANITIAANDLEDASGGPDSAARTGRSPVSFGMPTCLVKSLQSVEHSRGAGHHIHKRSNS